MALSWMQVPVLASYVRQDGSMPSGFIIFESTEESVVINGVTYAPKFTSVRLINGALPTGFTLPSASDPLINVSGRSYKVTERIIGGRPPFFIFIPFGSLGVNLNTIVPSVPPAQLPTIQGPPGESGYETRSFSQVSAPELSVNLDLYDLGSSTAQAEPLLVTNPTGNVEHGRRMLLTVKDAGVSQPISFGSKFQGAVAALPTDTVAGKEMYLGFMYHAPTDKWSLLAFANTI